MISRLSGAFLRAILVALLIATPTMMSTHVAAEASQTVVLVALLAAILTFAEYSSRYPSIIGFRFAPPFNRLRFAAYLGSVILLSLIIIPSAAQFGWSDVAHDSAVFVAQALDFPYSPVRMLVMSAPAGTSAEVVETLRLGAAVAYAVGIAVILVFLIWVRVFGWPMRHGGFNVWINLPLFDPTAGGDVLTRLKRAANLKTFLGFLLPFLSPLAVPHLLTPASLAEPQTLIWVITLWACFPATLVMRGIAISRIAEMVEEQRRRAYATETREKAQTA